MYNATSLANQHDNPGYSTLPLGQAGKSEKPATVKISELDNDVNYDIIEKSNVAGTALAEDGIYKYANENVAYIPERNDGLYEVANEGSGNAAEINGGVYEMAHDAQFVQDDKTLGDSDKNDSYNVLSTVSRSKVDGGNGSFYNSLRDDLRVNNNNTDYDQDASTAHRGLYNHIDSKGKTGDTYDSTNTSMTSHAVDDDYNHIGNSKCVNSNHVTSDVYNHIDSEDNGAGAYDSADNIVTSHACDDDYSHIGEVPDDTYYNVGNVSDVTDGAKFDIPNESEYVNYPSI